MTLPPFQIDVHESADSVRIAVSGELDLSVADRVRDALASVRGQGGGRRVVLDLSAVSFIDSTGLQLLLIATTESRSDGNLLSIVPSEAVSRLVELTGAGDRIALSADG